MSGRPCRAIREGFFEIRLVLAKPFTVQQEIGIKLHDHLFNLLRGEKLTEPFPENSLNLSDRVLAVKQAHGKKGRERQEDDLVGHVERITKADIVAALRADRKRLEVPEFWKIHLTPSFGGRRRWWTF